LSKRENVAVKEEGAEGRAEKKGCIDRGVDLAFQKSPAMLRVSGELFQGAGIARRKRS
jgi:hypothetical protein